MLLGVRDCCTYPQHSSTGRILLKHDALVLLLCGNEYQEVRIFRETRERSFEIVLDTAALDSAITVVIKHRVKMLEGNTLDRVLSMEEVRTRGRPEDEAPVLENHPGVLIGMCVAREDQVDVPHDGFAPSFISMIEVVRDHDCHELSFVTRAGPTLILSVRFKHDMNCFIYSIVLGYCQVSIHEEDWYNEGTCFRINLV